MRGKETKRNELTALCFLAGPMECPSNVQCHSTRNVQEVSAAFCLIEISIDMQSALLLLEAKKTTDGHCCDQ